jgi:DNA-binding CsgD family transcriptional regulator
MSTLAVTSLAEVEFRMGDWRAAYASAVEALGLAFSSGRGDETRQALASLALIEAGLGREQACRSHAGHALAMAASAPNDTSDTRAREALGLLELGLGHFDASVAWLDPLAGSATRATDTCDADLTEALFRRGDRARAANALALAEARARTPWSERALERCRGLLAADDEFEAHFVRALDRCASLADPFGRARTELCFGQRLRRVGRRVAARGRLRSALETFERLGAVRWTDTAVRELRASGERAQRRSGPTADGLTARELQVAREVAEGATNHEAAAALFVTVKTIEAHLRSIYRKLGIRSRAELGATMRERAAERET